MNKNSGAKLEIKKGNKETKQAKPEQPLKPVIEQKSKQKDKNDKKVKTDKVEVSEQKDKTSKKKDKKNREQQKGQQKSKKEKQQKSNKKDRKEKEKDKKDKKDKDNKDKKDKDKIDKNDKSGIKQSSPKKQQSKKNILSNKKGDKQLDTINNVQKPQKKAKMTIEELIQQYKSEAQRLLFQNHGHDPDKERMIQRQLQEYQKEKEKRHKKLEQLRLKKQQIEKSQQKSKEVKIQLRKQKIRQRKMKKIEQKLSSIEISAQQRRKDYQKFISYIQERKKIKPRFKKYEQQYEEYLQQQQRDYRDKLDELSRKYDPMNPSEIQSFEENYLAQKQESIHYRQNKLKLQQDLIKEQNDRRQKLLWKGQCHKNIENEESTRLQKKKQPWEKLEAIKEYGRFVAQNLKKTKQEIGENEKQNGEEQEEQHKNSRIAYHEKYHQGVNLGLVPYELPSPLSLEDKVKKGNQYLIQIREMNKSRRNKTVDYTNANSSRQMSISQDLKKDSKTYRLKRKSNPYYPIQQKKKQVDFKNYESIQFTLERLNSLKKDRELNDQIVKHGQHASILDIQERKRRGGSLVIKEINQKLNILKKL